MNSVLFLFCVCMRVGCKIAERYLRHEAQDEGKECHRMFDLEKFTTGRPLHTYIYIYIHIFGNRMYLHIYKLYGIYLNEDQLWRKCWEAISGWRRGAQWQRSAEIAQKICVNIVAC